MKNGAAYLKDNTCKFLVWAPGAESLTLKIVNPQKQEIVMQKDKKGYWEKIVNNIAPGYEYFFVINGQKQRPDPASFSQPQGVHGPSCVIDHNAFNWQDKDFKVIPLDKLVIYELHVGTFTDSGTFCDIIPRLTDLAALGINTLELMPVAAFPGARNWGYDGVYPYAVHNSYGGPQGLKTLINACHLKGINVILDVVYNHLGPEGNYLADFGPYFTGKYSTVWGPAINYDDQGCEPVRKFFIQNALFWLEQYHVDGLRLDACHSIFDKSKKHILQELSEAVAQAAQKNNKDYFLIAESDLNDVRLIKTEEQNGYGINAQWNDDFHHSLHTLLTGENNGYYQDFGKIENLTQALKEGFVYQGQYSKYRQRVYGTDSSAIAKNKFIVFSQNHDQVGNRMFGERLSGLVCFESLKLAAACVIFSGYIPLLFMGEEYGEDVPFLYFVSHSDADLIEAVRRGRMEEFSAFDWQKKPPNPQDEETFIQSKIKWEKQNSGNHSILKRLYKQLIHIKINHPAFDLIKAKCQIKGLNKENVVLIRRWYNNNEIFCLMNFNKENVCLHSVFPEGKWKKFLDSSDLLWLGKGSGCLGQINSQEKNQAIELNARSFVLYENC